MLLSSLIELLDQKKTTQPQQQAPKYDLLDHRRTEAATIEPKPRRRCRLLWLKNESLEDGANSSRGQFRP
jgi:hypothetical protein